MLNKGTHLARAKQGRTFFLKKRNVKVEISSKRTETKSASAYTLFGENKFGNKIFVIIILDVSIQKSGPSKKSKPGGFC